MADVSGIRDAPWTHHNENISDVVSQDSRVMDTGSHGRSRSFRRFTCAICGTGFPLKKTLKRHMDTVHRNEAGGTSRTEHQCSTCGRSFKRKDILTRHERYQHRGQKVDGPICCISVTERSLPEHRRSRSCIAVQDMQALQDTRQINIFRNAARVLSSDAVCHPLIALSQLSACQSYARQIDPPLLPPLRNKFHRSRQLKSEPRSSCSYADRMEGRLFVCTLARPYRTTEGWQEVLCSSYSELRGLTMRTIARALSDRLQATSSELAGALLAASMLDWRVGLQDCTALYQKLLRLTWTSGRYAKERKNIRALLLSAFAAPDMHKSKTCCLNVGTALGEDDLIWIADVYGTIVMSDTFALEVGLSAV